MSNEDLKILKERAIFFITELEKFIQDIKKLINEEAVRPSDVLLLVERIPLYYYGAIGMVTRAAFNNDDEESK